MPDEPIRIRGMLSSDAGDDTVPCATRTDDSEIVCCAICWVKGELELADPWSDAASLACSRCRFCFVIAHEQCFTRIAESIHEVQPSLLLNMLEKSEEEITAYKAAWKDSLPRVWACGVPDPRLCPCCSCVLRSDA